MFKALTNLAAKAIEAGRKLVNRATAKVAAALAPVVAAPAALAQAALPTGVDAAITDAGEMLVLGGTSVIIAMVGFWAVRKLGSKMGWW